MNIHQCTVFVRDNVGCHWSKTVRQLCRKEFGNTGPVWKQLEPEPHQKSMETNQQQGCR